MLVGRDSELEAIEGLLATGGALTLVGEAGAGKTALLGEARRRAVGFTVAAARGTERESGLPFAGLADIARPLRGLRRRARAGCPVGESTVRRGRRPALARRTFARVRGVPSASAAGGCCSPAGDPRGPACRRADGPGRTARREERRRPPGTPGRRLRGRPPAGRRRGGQPAGAPGAARRADGGPARRSRAAAPPAGARRRSAPRLRGPDRRAVGRGTHGAAGGGGGGLGRVGARRPGVRGHRFSAGGARGRRPGHGRRTPHRAGAPPRRGRGVPRGASG
jgi:hypothetical protein